MRGAVIGTIAVAGLGLFGTGVHGLAQVDGKLTDAADRPAARGVKNELRAKPGDCPRREQHRFDERRRL